MNCDAVEERASDYLENAVTADIWLSFSFCTSIYVLVDGRGGQKESSLKRVLLQNCHNLSHNGKSRDDTSVALGVQIRELRVQYSST